MKSNETRQAIFDMWYKYSNATVNHHNEIDDLKMKEIEYVRMVQSARRIATKTVLTKSRRY